MIQQFKLKAIYKALYQQRYEATEVMCYIGYQRSYGVIGGNKLPAYKYYKKDVRKHIFSTGTTKFDSHFLRILLVSLVTIQVDKIQICIPI